MRTLFGTNSSGTKVVALTIDGDAVEIDSKLAKIKRLAGKSLEKRVARKAKGIVADGFVSVGPGSPDYLDALIDTLEGMGINVVG